jgi:hypothetical protein
MRRTAVLAVGLGALAAVALLGACGATRTEPSARANVERVAELLTGVFSSAEQARVEPAYFEVRLVVHPIWTEREDGPWLYVEQAMATAVDQPYRQRVYHLVADGEAVVSEVYELPDAARAVGCFREERPLADLAPQGLLRRAGCEIVLVPVGAGEFQGSTLGTACPSSLNGASYATSQVVLREGLLASWDRGFDAAGRQVWGATAGAYEFLREGDVAALVARDGAR